MSAEDSVRQALGLVRDSGLFRRLLDLVRETANALGRKPVLMEVCGSHTWAISHAGIIDLLKDRLSLVSGPGCPVCVTSAGDISRMVGLSRYPGVIVATYGDMMRVPSTSGSLEESRAAGNEVVMVYSAMDAVTLARENPGREVVFLGVGFETTAPGSAIALKAARSWEIENFSIYSAHKVMPPILRKILSMDELRIDGLILPGHVSAVTGKRYFEFIGEEFHVPAVISGFEPCDILYAILRLLQKMLKGDYAVENAYPRVVSEEGNIRAQDLINEVFEPGPSTWRGIGELPESGLALRPAFSQFDASKKLPLEPLSEEAEPPGCDCRYILSGLKAPEDCRLFGKVCTPVHPVGPCMVSSEGSCRAHYTFGR